MKTVQLKNILIQKIAASNDKSFLSSIKTIIDAKSETLIYRTTSEQRQSIKDGQEQKIKSFYSIFSFAILSSNMMWLFGEP
jgi:hypothetical protein